MKIAFVGKGGSGKTTASSLFAQYQSQNHMTLAIDADINMHMAELLSGERPGSDLLISEKAPSEAIRTYLRGTNERIESNAHFKKSTPPSHGSNFVTITSEQDWLLNHYGQKVNDSLTLLTVGSYSEDGIASSCYHNNLSVLENVLSHTLDHGTVVTDMVAGTDAFASTLFAQFNLLVFIVEPTMRSVAVLEQYKQLAGASGVGDSLFVIANKIDDEEDMAFIREHVDSTQLIGAISRSAHLLKVDKGREALDITKLTDEDQSVFKTLSSLLEEHTIPMQKRLETIWKLHKIYVNQAFIKDRFGDLTRQIDTDFIYPKE